MSELLTVNEVAGRLKCSRATVYRILATGELQSVKVGERQRISEDALAAYLAPAKENSNQ